MHSDSPPATVVSVLMFDEPERTAHVVDSVLEDRSVDLLVLADNGSKLPRSREWLDRLERQARKDHRLEVERRTRLGPATSIYAVWNAHVRRAVEVFGPVTNVAILNNDLRMVPGTIGHLARALRSSPPEVAAVYPDWRRPLADGVDVTGEVVPTRGAWRAGGLSGFAFMFRAELLVEGVVPWFDERYAWIYGDGDFVEGLEMAGFTAARVEGLPLEHDKSTTANRVSWTRAAKAEDTRRRKAKVAEREA